MKPFIKWVGGKTQIIDTVIGLFPKEIQNYHEPFVGGGSVLLALLSSPDIHISGNIYASDLNANLIGLYKNVQSHPDELIAETKKLIAEFITCSGGTTIIRNASTLEEARTSPESYYFWIRARFNAFSKDERVSVNASAMLLFMNKTCFRGVYREGPRGFNVPFGNYKNPSILDEDHIKAVSALLKPVIFTSCGFSEAFSKVLPDDFVYLDPPYAPANTTSFVGYTADGFALENHKTLFELCKTTRAKILLSNADVPLVKESFSLPVYTTSIIACRRSIHSKEPGTKANEVLITNYY